MTNTDSAQTPKVQPRPDSQIVIKLEQESVKPSIPSAQQLNNLTDKRRLLKALNTQFNMNLRLVKVDLQEGNGLHTYGDELHFSIDTGNKRLNALTLFNLTDNAPHIPNINQIITNLQKQTCQVGQKAFFTSDDSYSR